MGVTVVVQLQYQTGLHFTRYGIRVVEGISGEGTLVILRRYFRVGFALVRSGGFQIVACARFVLQIMLDGVRYVRSGIELTVQSNVSGGHGEGCRRSGYGHC